MKVLIFATHPIQYQAPIYRALHKVYNLKVIYLLNQTSKQQAESGFGVEFDWDVPLLDGYNYQYLKNYAKHPSSSTYDGILLNKKELHQLFQKEQPDIVIINGWFPKGLKQVINYCYKNNIITLCRGDSTLLMTNSKLKKVLKEIYIRTILRKINAYLYVGNENRKYYLHYGIKESRLYPALHCINTPFFDEHFNKIVKPDFNPQIIKIGFSGKFISKKQPLLLIEAIANSNYKNNIQLQLIGDGPLKNDMIKIANEKGVSIHFLGFLNQSEIVSKGYSKIDFLVLPSGANETWGLVVNEVMTGGIPAIVSDTVGCFSDLIIEGKTGFVFKSGDVNDLTNKIDQLIVLLEKKTPLKDFVLNSIQKYSLGETVTSFKNAIEKVKNLD